MPLSQSENLYSSFYHASFLVLPAEGASEQIPTSPFFHTLQSFLYISNNKTQNVNADVEKNYINKPVMSDAISVTILFIYRLHFKYLLEIKCLAVSL